MINEKELFNILNKTDKNFIVKEGIVNGVNVTLINPIMSTEWSENNLDLRSIMLDGKSVERFLENPAKENMPIIISHGFPKFFNHFEEVKLKKCDISFSNEELLKACFVPKIDGSCLLVDLINGKLNARTRGSLNAMEKFPNTADELLELLKKNILNNSKKDALFEILKDHTIIFEWTTPSNRIILDYGSNPELHLIGIIKKSWDLFMMSQSDLNTIARLCNFERSRGIEILTLNDLTRLYKQKDIEGYCAYLPDGKTIIKYKTEEYMLAASAASRGLMNINSLYKFWVHQPNRLSNDTEILEKLIEDTFSEEVLEIIRKDGVLDIWDSYNVVTQNLICHVYNLIMTAAYKICVLEGWSIDTLPENEIFILNKVLDKDTDLTIKPTIFDSFKNEENTARTNIGKFYQIISSQVEHSSVLKVVFGLMFKNIKIELAKPLEKRISILNKVYLPSLSRNVFIKIMKTLNDYNDIDSIRLDIEAKFFSIDKTLFIVRGVPGSGKSSMITTLIQNSLTIAGQKNKVKVYSTDNYFVDPDTGEYNFDFNKLKENHQKCFDSCKKSMELNIPFIFLDNTNIKEAHIKPYRDIANINGYTIMEIYPNDMFELLVMDDPIEIERMLCLFAKRNKHGVDKNTIKRMYLELMGELEKKN